MTDIEAVHPPADRLSAYAQGRLDEPEMDEIEQHLSSCDSCCQCDPGPAGGLAGREAPRPRRRDGRGGRDGGRVR